MKLDINDVATAVTEELKFLYNVGDVVIIKEHGGLEWSGIVVSREYDEDCYFYTSGGNGFWYMVEPLADKPNFRKNPACIHETEIKQRKVRVGISSRGVG